ncbi:prephenate dehydratase [Candidatus Poribacteria bacterium]|nr:prephenate dehydratase [Candidatus Poribacteria bacterium]
MSDLDRFRQEIDEIDRELVNLLDRRARIALEVGRAKAGEGRPTYDPGRQRAVLERAHARSEGAFPREGLDHVLREVLSACLNLQKPLRVAYLGPAATFAHQAAIREFGSSVEFEAYDKIPEIFQAVHQNWADHGVVPVENSTGGMVHETLDCFLDYECRICHEILLPIHHSLLGNVAIESIRRIFSHPQTFAQCGTWLREHLPDAELVEMPSTVAGMQRAKEFDDAAAIGSDVAAEQYALRVIARGIEDNPDNTTRFLVIALNDTPACGENKTSLMFSVKDKPGALFNLLKPFAEEGINLSKIESRPTKRKAWEYVFFVDVVGHRTDEPVQRALARLEPNCHMLRVLGSYPLERSPAGRRT